MFIKFSDKTKKIMVKNSREDIGDGYLEENCIYLDEKDKDDRRVKALSDDKAKASESNN